MICPQRDSFQLFWQHLKKEAAMLSEIALTLQCYTATMAHLNFKVCSSQGNFRVPKNIWGGIFFFIIHSIKSQETLFVSANLQ